jgi:hypothetical protein
MLMAFLVEEHYVSRGSIVANTVGMFVAIAPHWDTTRSWLGIFHGYSIFHAYLLVGLIFGAIAFFSYVTEESAPSEFYWTAWAFYNTVFGVLVCLAATFVA